MVLTIVISQLQFDKGGLRPCCADCAVHTVVDIPAVAQRQSLMVQTVCLTIDIPQLLYKVVDIPVVHDRADFPVMVQMPFPMVQTARRTMVFPQFVLDKVIVVPVVQNERDLLVPSWRRLLLWFSSYGTAHHRVDELMG